MCKVKCKDCYYHKKILGTESAMGHYWDNDYNRLGLDECEHPERPGYTKRYCNSVYGDEKIYKYNKCSKINKNNDCELFTSYKITKKIRKIFWIFKIVDYIKEKGE